MSLTPSQQITEDYIKQLERLVAVHETTIQDMKNILEIELENTAPDGPMEHEANHACLICIKALYKLIGAYNDR